MEEAARNKNEGKERAQGRADAREQPGPEVLLLGGGPGRGGPGERNPTGAAAGPASSVPRAGGPAGMPQST